MSRNPGFDRWYAATHVKVILRPSNELETFGSTLVNYHMISELPDLPGKVRIRRGRLEAHEPRVILPQLNQITVEGLGPLAKEYMEFLQKNMRILRYGYNIRSDNFSEQIVTDSLSAVTERVKEEVVDSGDRFAAVLQGIDEPWEISIVELWRREVERAANKNLNELHKNGKLFF